MRFAFLGGEDAGGVSQPAGESELIQVSADATATETMHREMLALDEAGRVHPGTVKRLLVLTRAVMPREAPRGVIVQPAYEWMLGT